MRNTKSTAGFRRIRPNVIVDRPVTMSKTVSEREINIGYLKSQASFRKLKLTYSPKSTI